MTTTISSQLRDDPTIVTVHWESFWTWALHTVPLFFVIIYTLPLSRVLLLLVQTITGITSFCRFY